MAHLHDEKESIHLVQRCQQVVTTRAEYSEEEAVEPALGTEGVGVGHIQRRHIAYPRSRLGVVSLDVQT
jgi:hypothetical protein